MPGGLVFVALVAVQRFGELVLARRNTGRLLAAGGREAGAGHYPLIVAVHAGWLAALAGFGWMATPEVLLVGVYALLQAFRIWILLSLGARWTTRIIVIDIPMVRRGPYRFLRHPNYLLVVLEIAVAPLALGLVWVAVGFSVLNALVLAIRIPAEQKAWQAARLSAASK